MLLLGTVYLLTHLQIISLPQNLLMLITHWVYWEACTMQGVSKHSDFKNHAKKIRAQ